MKIKSYKFGINVSAIALFALIMLPNIIWSFVPSQNDVLRNPSSTQILDTFMSVFQVVMIAALCIIKNKNAGKFGFSLLVICSAVFVALYYVCWILYYCGIIGGIILIGLCVFPCCAFLLYAVDRKNYIALIPAIVFSVLHLISTIINFL